MTEEPFRAALVALVLAVAACSADPAPKPALGTLTAPTSAPGPMAARSCGQMAGLAGWMLMEARELAAALDVAGEAVAATNLNSVVGLLATTDICDVVVTAPNECVAGEGVAECRWDPVPSAP